MQGELAVILTIFIISVPILLIANWHTISPVLSKEQFSNLLRHFKACKLDRDYYIVFGPNKEYIYKPDFGTLNEVSLSYFQNRQLKKIILHKKLNLDNLTDASQILYGKD